MSLAPSTPQTSSGSGQSTPAPPTGASTPSSASGSTSKPSHKPKQVNIFSDDGSFLQRFRRVKREDEDKKKRDQELESKRIFESRFKNRGKRRAPSAEPTDPTPTASDNASASAPTPTPTPTSSKKAKLETDKPQTAYEKEVKSYSDSLKDNGMGIRPLVK